MGYGKYVKALYKNKESMKQLGDILMARKMAWRREGTIVRVEHPTRMDRAREYGYRAKQGFIIVRAKVRRGGLHKKRPSRGRKPAGMAIHKITAQKSIQRMAEERAQDHYPNLQVLASYWVLEDGRHKWYEVIMVDPHHPAIVSDRKIGWLAKEHKGRVYMGLTPAGKKGRGLMRHGKGTEKNRPSLRANDNKAK
ncbi:MAG: 50S ribosomal protein L15e [Candidatus Altiarchaeota archaeon]